MGTLATRAVSYTDVPAFCAELYGYNKYQVTMATNLVELRPLDPSVLKNLDVHAEEVFNVKFRTKEEFFIALVAGGNVARMRELVEGNILSRTVLALLPRELQSTDMAFLPPDALGDSRAETVARLHAMLLWKVAPVQQKQLPLQSQVERRKKKK